MDKTCRTCGETKSTTEFYPNTRYSDGLTSDCKRCYRAKLAQSQMKPPRHHAPEGMKRCTICKETKPTAEFAKNKNFHDGLSRGCRACYNVRSSAYGKANRKRLSADQLRRFHENPERYADYDLKKRFGLEPGTYDKMLAAQNGVCAICLGKRFSGNGKRRFAVDHDAETGRIRGLLCGNCNTGIGQLHHDRTILLAAIKYLDDHDK